MKYVLRFLLPAVLCLLLLSFPAVGAEGGASTEVKKGDIVKLKGDIYVNKGTVVEGNVVTLKGNIYVNGEVKGEAVTIMGDIMVNEGIVRGDAVAVAGSIVIGEEGKVLGNTVEAIGGALRGRGYNYKYEYNYRPGMNLNLSGKIFSAFTSFFVTLGFFLLAALVYLIMPKKVEEMADTTESAFGRRMGIGLLAVVASPVAMIILSIALFITIVGIFIIPFIWIAYFITLLIALVPAYMFLGQKIGELVSRNKAANFRALAIGMFSVWFINAILSFGGLFTGWVSFLITFSIVCLGAGILIDYIISNRKKKPSYGGYYTGGESQNGPGNMPPPYGPDNQQG